MAKTELAGRVLVLVAHADDESVAYGALMQKMREAVVVIATDGTPRDEYFWGRFGSREAYRAVRKEEARRAVQAIGVGRLVLLAEEDERLEDQRLFLNLNAAWARLEPLVEQVRPEAIATLAYEGGHPDHDSCSLLAARLGERFAVPVWETAVYSREVTAAGGEAKFGCSVSFARAAKSVRWRSARASWSAKGRCVRNINRRVIFCEDSMPGVR